MPSCLSFVVKDMSSGTQARICRTLPNFSYSTYLARRLSVVNDDGVAIHPKMPRKLLQGSVAFQEGEWHSELYVPARDV